MIEDRYPGDGMSSRGFTLIEMIIILGIMAILLTIAYPSFQRYAINGNLRSAARDLVGDFNNQKQRAMSGVKSENPANEGARAHRILLDLGANSYTLQRCTTTENICGNWEDLPGISVKNLNAYGNDVAFDPTKPNTLVFDFQTRGTVSEGSIFLVNSRDSKATVTLNISGRTYVDFDMR
jgi:prepilin-type N-terminal cleavage/methylation domain-containing protein